MTANVFREMNDDEVWQRTLVDTARRLRIAGRAWRSTTERITRSCELIAIGPSSVRGRVKYGNDDTACTVHESCVINGKRLASVAPSSYCDYSSSAQLSHYAASRS